MDKKTVLKEMTDDFYSVHDLEAAKKLDAFLPGKIFDAHMHLSDRPFGIKTVNLNFTDYYTDTAPLFSNREVICNGIANPYKELRAKPERQKMTNFIVEELKKYPKNVAEILVHPDDTVEEIEGQLIHPNICGFKCYHLQADRPDTYYASIGEYLPESVWQVANERGLVITLHMVRPKALADEENMRYIKGMAKRYPNVTLILAHAARGFAAWTTIETVAELAPYENVWFDFSGICESPAMIAIINKIGIDRCMWGSDWPVTMLCGKGISLGESFYWIYKKDLESFSSATEFHPYLIGTENLMATREACILTNLNEDSVEKLFYSNAAKLFKIK